MTGRYARRRSSSGRAWLPVGLAVAVLASLVAVGSVSQGSGSAEAAERVMPRSGASDDTLGYWTPMGIRVRTGDDSFQDPGLNQAVYALAMYDDSIYAGGLFDDTGGGGNNEANCSDDAEYPLQCIAVWSEDDTAWRPVGGGFNNEVKTLTVMGNSLYAGGLFDDTVGGPGVGSCKPLPGVRWNSHTLPLALRDDSWSSVVWGDDSTGIIGGDEGFVAVASAADDTPVMTSSDGVNWDKPPGPVPASAWQSVTWGDDSTAIDADDDTFVAVASSGGTRVMTSNDGVTWIGRTVGVDPNAWRSVAWGDSTPTLPGGARFVAVASSGTNRVMTSADGATWTPRAAASANSWSSVAWGSAKFVAVASGGDDTRVMYSTDGENWLQPSTRVPNRDWQSVTWANNIFVAVASSGDDTRVMTSEDGIKWVPRASSFYENSWKSVTWAGDMFVAVGDSGNASERQVMTSRDGVTWSSRTTGTVPNEWQSVARGDAGEPGKAADDTVVAVGAGGTLGAQVMTSVEAESPGELRCISAWNGSMWSPLAQGLDGDPTALAALGDDTLVVG
ncbi:MAG: hypothetical protein B7C55_01460, partial [Actinomycetales bacterium mxb001]